MRLSDNLIEQIKKDTANGFISSHPKPDSDKILYNYTHQAQFKNHWTEATMMCRGLMLDYNYNIIARPFNKFFNLEELDGLGLRLPNEPFDAYDKLDGSLGILYWENDKPLIATRNSFYGEQATIATGLLHFKYEYVLDKLDKTKTYLFEIIYPENKIVIDYGNTIDIFLLAVIDKETGLDCPIPNIGFPIVKKFDVSNLNELTKIDSDNREGFVLKYRSGFRVKIKYKEYVGLHRALNLLSLTTIWEQLSTVGNCDALCGILPDECYDWINEQENSLKKQYADIENICLKDFKDLGDRKTTAMYFKTCKYPAVLFSMLDKHNYGNVIWKIIKPKEIKKYKV